MKINHIIKSKRMNMGYTQEQLAELLGVTAPAVNKWEKGSSYPDITLLPVLARALKTDLNTLLSFKDDLTQAEMAEFLNRLSKTAATENVEKAFELAKEKIREYPESCELILYCAIIIESASAIEKSGNIKSHIDESQIDLWYEKACCSDDIRVKSMAQSAIVNRFIRNNNFDEAEKIIKEIPGKLPVDKKQLEINLALEKGEYEKAALLQEEKLLLSVTEILSDMIGLMQTTIKMGSLEDAKYISEVSSKAAKIFDLQEYNVHVPKFMYLGSAGENREELSEEFSALVNSTEEKWDVNSSPLYRMIKSKENKEFGKILKRCICYEIENNESMKYLKETETYKKLKEEITFPQVSSQSHCDKS